LNPKSVGFDTLSGSGIQGPLASVFLNCCRTHDESLCNQLPLFIHANNVWQRGFAYPQSALSFLICDGICPAVNIYLVAS